MGLFNQLSLSIISHILFTIFCDLHNRNFNRGYLTLKINITKYNIFIVIKCIIKVHKNIILKLIKNIMKIPMNFIQPYSLQYDG